MSQNELFDTLSLIAMHKELLPFRLRGWVNALGLYIREHKAGQWTRLRAGGKYRSYIDVWIEGDGQWDIRRFDSDTWERRFARLVDPTGEILDFLLTSIGPDESLDSESAWMLDHVTRHFQDTGEWLGLPYFGVSSSKEQAEQATRQWLEEKNDRTTQKYQEIERRSRLQRISELEARTLLNDNNGIAYSALAMEYAAERRFKDMEFALKQRIEAYDSHQSLEGYGHWHLGMAYLASLAYVMRGKGLPIWGNAVEDVTSESLGYSSEQLKSLAIIHLSEARALLDSRSELNDEINTALRAANNPSNDIFEQYDRLIVEKAEEQREAAKLRFNESQDNISKESQ